MENLEILFTNLRVSSKIRKNHSHESIKETVHKKIRAASSRQAAGVIYIASYQKYIILRTIGIYHWL